MRAYEKPEPPGMSTDTPHLKDTRGKQRRTDTSHVQGAPEEAETNLSSRMFEN